MKAYPTSPSQTLGLGRHPHRDTPGAESLYPVRALPTYRATDRTVKYWWQNGAWLDQGETSTCVGNAFAHRRADSPQPVAGITEGWARELYVAASGDTTLQQGTSAILACRVLAERGIISQYHWITSPAELRNTILTLGAVCVGTDWLNSMFYPVKNYLPVSFASGVAGGHEYVINGINLDPPSGPPFYRIKQSWSRAWGNNGNVRIACSSLEKLLFERNGDAVLIKENR